MDLRKAPSLYFQLKFGHPPPPNFEKFDANIGVAGYCAAIRKYLMPDSTPETFSVAQLPFESRLYCKGSIFSRVRRIRNEKLDDFLNSPLKSSDFCAPEVEKTRAGRFNAQGERTLYLADHPFVALKECEVEPGDHFLLSYFVFKTDTQFVSASASKSKYTKLLNSLLTTKDKNFYEVITRTYNDLLNYKTHHGIAYNSVKIPEKHCHTTWGEIDSITNLAMTEEKLSAAELQVGWLARCDEHYRPYYIKILSHDVKNKKRIFTSQDYHKNKSRFMTEHRKAMRQIYQLSKRTKTLIKRKDHEGVNAAPLKLLTQEWSL